MKKLKQKQLSKLHTESGFIGIVLIGIVLSVLVSAAILFGLGIIKLPSSQTPQIIKTILPSNQTSEKQVITQTIQDTFEPITEPNFQSFPIIEEGNLILVPLPEYGTKPIKASVKDQESGGAIYLGEQRPLAAPNLKKTAYIEKGILGFITADGKTDTKLPKEYKIEYINSWSPDSKKLIVYVQKQSLNDINGYGTNYYPQYDPNKKPGGFYIVDTEKGSLTFLEPVDSFVSWIGNTSLLVLLSTPRQNQASKDDFMVFDLNTFKADAKILENKFESYFGKHFSFSANGKKWAISLGNTEHSPTGSFSNITLADFPNTEGKTIDQGTWAAVQQPLISPAGDRVVYINHPGGDSWFTKLWDGKEIKLFQSGRPQVWVNNNQFIMSRVDFDPAGDGKSTNHVYLYDIPSGKETKLY